MITIMDVSKRKSVYLGRHDCERKPPDDVCLSSMHIIDGGSTTPIKIVFSVVQTRNVMLSDLIVATFTDRKQAERYVLRQCYQYGDGISQLTNNFVPFSTYEEYATCTGLPFYMYPNKPALHIIESSLNPSFA